jgi:hypothetical protein
MGGFMNWKRLILLGFFFGNSFGSFFAPPAVGGGGGGSFSLDFSQATNSFYYGF